MFEYKTLSGPDPVIHAIPQTANERYKKTPDLTAGKKVFWSYFSKKDYLP